MNSREQIKYAKARGLHVARGKSHWKVFDRPGGRVVTVIPYGAKQPNRRGVAGFKAAVARALRNPVTPA